MKIKIIKENNEYQFKSYKIDEIWNVSFIFDEYFIATKNKEHAKAILKSDCEIQKD